MPPTLVTSCPHYEAISRDVDRHQRWIGDLEADQRAHATGNGHVTRREMDTCMEAVERLTAMLQALATTVAAATAEQTLWQKLQIPVATGVVVGMILTVATLVIKNS
jgi:hypothetical protein